MPRVCRWGRSEDGACQHSGEHGAAAALCSNVSQGSHGDVEMIGALMSDFVGFFLFFSLGPLLKKLLSLLQLVCFVIKFKTSSTGQVAGVSASPAGSLLH